MTGENSPTGKSAGVLLPVCLFLAVAVMFPGCGGGGGANIQASPCGCAANQSAVLYGVDTVTGWLIRIDPASGAAVPVGPVGFPDVQGLAFDHNTSTLYGVSNTVSPSPSQLIKIDTSTGVGTAVGGNLGGFTIVWSLTFDPNANILYGISNLAAGGQLIRINTTTGAGTAIGTMALGIASSIAFDSQTNTLYGVTGLFSTGPELSIINTTDGTYTLLGPIAQDGLTFDPTTNILYGSRVLGSNSTSLYTINPSNAADSLVGPVSTGGNVRSLASACTPNNTLAALYGVDTDTDRLIKIDPASGAGTVIGLVGWTDVQGLTFGQNARILYGGSNALSPSPSQLITIDPSTGVGTAVGGNLGSFTNVWSLTFDPSANKLYGISNISAGGQLIEINTTTGAGTAIGSPKGIVTCIAFDSQSNTLYGVTGPFTNGFPADELSIINTTDGTYTLVGSITMDGLTFDPSTNILYGTRVFTSSSSGLYTVNVSGPSASLVGTISTGGNVRSLAAAP